MNSQATLMLIVALAVLAVIAYPAAKAYFGAIPPRLIDPQVMLDLETLGTKPGCKVLSIGAVTFGPYGVMDTFYIEVKRDEGQEMLEEDPDTVEWWSRQTPEAKTLLGTPDSEKHSLTGALIAFNTWLRDVAPSDERGNLKVAVWGNGADFDNAILAHCYKAVKVKQAWPYWGNRCYRTLKGLRPDIKLERQGTHHNALDDAASQAEHATAICKALNLWGR